jgi:glycyl-tRNA synthetase beta chain
MIAKASGELKAILEKYFSTNGLIDSNNRIEAFGGPRRLTAIAHGVRLRQEDAVREVMGPPKLVASDHLGEPTRAAMSFAEKQGVPVSKLVTVNTRRRLRFGDAVDRRARRFESARRSATSSDSGISWPRSMYWTGAHGPRFIRPIRWIVAI